MAFAKTTDRCRAEALSEYAKEPLMNAINIILPYKWGATWVFDDPRVGLDKEPFVAGVPEMIDILLEQKGMKGVDRFRLTFSAYEFPGYDEKIDMQSGQVEQGTYYESHTFGRIGWLCPALARYFDQSPQQIYVKFEPMD
jgi:hypothetical protein